MQSFSKIAKIVLLSILSLALTNCGDGKTNQQNEQKNTPNGTALAKEVAIKEETKDEKPTKKTGNKQLWDNGKEDKRMNEIARFIAGLPQESDNDLKKHEENATWKNYATQSNTRWGTIMNKKVPKMTKWRDEELGKITEAGGFLFYPFSGADFLHAGTFFPTATEIVMIGLEPIGSVPDVEKITKSSMQYYFNGLNRSLATVLEYSFFKTLDMQVDLTGKVNANIDGTLHLLMLFMVRTNHVVLDVEKIAINAEGKMVSAKDLKNTQGITFGNKISFRRADNPEERKSLYYFSADISDAGFNAKPSFYKFLQSLKINTTYIKSASYLMYNASFSKIKNLILDQTQFHLQDDSGMPFASFKKDTWDLTFFGRYAGPIKLFAGRWQNDLNAAYKDKNNKIRPLPFGIGYQFAEGNSNLMLAEKKAK